MPILVTTTSLKRKRRRRRKLQTASLLAGCKMLPDNRTLAATLTLLLFLSILVSSIQAASHSTSTTNRQEATAAAATKQSPIEANHNNNRSQVVSSNSQRSFQEREATKTATKEEREAQHNNSNRSRWEELPMPQALSWLSPAAAAAATTRSRGPGQTTGAAASNSAQQDNSEVGEGLTLGDPSSSGSSSSAATGSSSASGDQRQWTLQQLERIKQEASKVSALVGQNVILNCAVEFKDGIEKPFVVNWLKYPLKLPIYIWYAGYPPHLHQGYENRVSRIGQASLNLSRVRESDQGLYECKIYYLDQRARQDKGSGTWIYLDVQAPPHFTQVPAPLNYVQAGDSLRLTCQAQSEPSPILRWYKNKTPIDSDEGPYRLSAGEPAVGEPQEQPTLSANSEGSDLVSSSAAAAAAAAAVASAGQTQRRLDLFIDNVQAGTTTGDYSCLASNSEGSVEARSQVVLAVPAVITTLPRNQTKLEGEKLELPCQARALPSNITYKWFFNDKAIQSEKWFESRYLIQSHGTLVINSLYRDDQGEYKCQVTNGLSHRAATTAPGSSSSSHVNVNVNANANANANSKQDSNKLAPIYAEASAHVTVEFPARITYSPQVQYLPLGLSGQIRCYVQAAPPVEFWTWTKNNAQFDPNLDPNIERLLNGSLLIKQVSKEYEGTYRCTPFNRHGSAGSSAAMEVRVQEPPYFELKPAEFYKATLNDQVKIPCSAKGVPKPSLSWRKVIISHQDSSASSSSSSSSSANLASGQQQQQHQQQSVISSSTTSTLALPAPVLLADEAAADESSSGLPATAMSTREDLSTAGSQGEQQEQQQSVISYGKLPSDRSEYKSAHLLLYRLKKEDHGRYECVIENEVATLVASTMLYVEETTPHAPTHVGVETKAWSAQVAWKPGYDGGFEQAFVVLYRQTDRANRQTQDANQSSSQTIINHQQPPTSELPPSSPPPPPARTAASSSEFIDFNWKSINVAPGTDSVTVHNLSQDTSYEFYVKAKNIIGEGPRSQLVQTNTKRALQGSLAPLEDHPLVGDPLASTYPYDASTVLSPVVVGDEEETEPGPTINPSVLGIIHLVDVTPPTAQGDQTTSSAYQSNSVQDTSSSSANNDQQQQQQQQSADNSSKVIRIYRPTKQSADQPSKRPRFDQPDSVSAPSSPSSSSSSSFTSSSQNSSNSDNSKQTTTQASFVDLSTAPRNVSMMKVAQGWVINWWPPKRPPSEPSVSERLAASTAAAGLLPALSQQLDQISSPSNQLDQMDENQQQQQQEQKQPAAYSIEFREKGKGWEQLATTKERSHLIKDRLKPGGEYLFRVYAHSAHGLKGSPSAEFSYLIPDNRRKPGSTQALSAGVVSGILFFVACIAMAVCAVNMCNKRRKRRAEKAAYVMMACPVLESHHDIAALNSNSLVKNNSNSNSSAAEEGGISGVRGRQLRENLREFQRSLLEPSGRSKDDSEPLAKRLNDNLCKFGRLLEANFRRLLNLSGEEEEATQVQVRSAAVGGQLEVEQLEQRSVRYSSNAPVAVDVVEPIIVEHRDEPDMNCEKIATVEPSAGGGSLDDYWICGPSNRKWGTLTVAASKLAERRARERQARAAAAAAKEVASGSANEHQQQQQDRDSITDELFYCSVGDDGLAGAADMLPMKNLKQPGNSRTLPRSFRASPIKQQHPVGAAAAAARFEGNLINKRQQLGSGELQNQSHRQQEQFTAWLNEQLVATRSGQSDYGGASNGSASANNNNTNTNNTIGGRAGPPPPPFGNDDWRAGGQVDLVASSSAANKQQVRSSCGGHQRSMSQIEPTPSLFDCIGSHNNNNYTAAALLSYYQWQNYNHYLQRHHLPPPPPPPPLLMSLANCQLQQPLIQKQRHYERGTMMFGRQLDSSDSVPMPPATMGPNPPAAALHQLQSAAAAAAASGLAMRNSPARRTLPMTHQQRNFYPQPPPPPQPQMQPQPQPPVESKSICAFYPPMTFGATNNVAPRAELPVNGEANNNDNDGDDIATSDDPLTANACLGSNRRKRRLPHIEAKFSISASAYKHDDERANNKLSACAAAGAGAAAAVAEGDGQDGGHLFVRSINQPEGVVQRQPEVAEPGYPRPGQRSEQRRWRPPPQLAHVETIGAREKIESYLRHYDDATRQVQYASAASDAFDDDNHPTTTTTTTAMELVEMDRVDELTFQPYYNLPSLKYTIKLPIHKRADGTLLLNETSQLRQSHRRRRPRHPHPHPDSHETSAETNCTAAAETGASTSVCKELSRSGQQQRQHLRPFGSSSSCPAPPITIDDDGNGPQMDDDNDNDLRVLALDGGPAAALSLESGLSQPTTGHPLRKSAGGINHSNQIPKDSLEKSMDSMAHTDASVPQPPLLLLLPPPGSSVAGDQLPATRRIATAAAATEEGPPVVVAIPREPFYLHPGIGAADVNVGGEKYGKPKPPPVPPHRSGSLSAIITTNKEEATNREGCERARRKSLEASSSSSPPSSSPPSSSPSPASSSSGSSSSSSSSSRGTTTADREAGESLTNDHSVDENYEFDAISSCSSSQQHQQRRQRIISSDPNQSKPESSPARKLIGPHLYTQVDKTRGRRLERSRLYDFSRQKEQPLEDCKPLSSSSSSPEYDTVQEANQLN